jgi:MFS transporter, FHS family, L-fucose permease
MSNNNASSTNATLGFRPVIIPGILLGVPILSAQLLIIGSPIIRTILDLDAGAFGWLLSSSLFAGTVGSVFGGWMADKGYVNITLISMLAMIGACFCAGGLPTTYIGLIVSFGFIGLGMSAISTIGNVVVARIYRVEGTRRALTWLQIIAGLASVLGPIFWAFVLDRFSLAGMSPSNTIRLSFIIAGLPVLALIALPLFRPLPNSPEATTEDNAAKNISVLGPGVIIIFVFVALHTGADNGIYVWLPDFVERTFQPTMFPAAWILSAYSAAYLVGRLVLTTISDSVEDLILLSIAPAVASVAAYAAFQSDNQLALAILYTTAGLAMSVTYPSILAHIGRNHPESMGRIMALAGAVSGGMSLVIPPAMGYLGTAFGSMRVGMLLPSAMLVALSLLAMFQRARTRVH